MLLASNEPSEMATSWSCGHNQSRDGSVIVYKDAFVESELHATPMIPKNLRQEKISLATKKRENNHEDTAAEIKHHVHGYSPT